MVRSRSFTGRSPQALLFVYGTLRLGAAGPMAAWLRNTARHVGVGQVRGRLYDLGRYPGLVEPARSADWVRGDLYVLARPRGSWRTLDTYEGASDSRGAAEYARVERSVRIGRRWCRAWLYLYLRPVRGKRRIPSGDYFAHPR